MFVRIRSAAADTADAVHGILAKPNVERMLKALNRQIVRRASISKASKVAPFSHPLLELLETPNPHALTADTSIQVQIVMVG